MGCLAAVMAVARSVTQDILDRLSAATLRHTPAQSHTVADRLEQAAEAHAERAFVLFEERRITYAELNADANRVAHALHQIGLRTGDVVALLMHNRPEFIATWAGLAKLGVTAALINTQLRGQALRHALATAGARTLIAGSECLENVASAGENLVDAERLLVRGDSAAGGTALDATLARMPIVNPDPALRRDLVAATTSSTSPRRARPASRRRPV
jgi:fatty-acyl-CoA synthase